MTSVPREGVQEFCISPFAVVEGPHSVHFSAGCVVHPFAVIVAKRGPIYFGAYCIVEEHACIFNGEPDSVDVDVAEATPSAVPMVIGSYNHFKSFSCVSNIHQIGHGNRFEAHCRVEGAGEVAGGAPVTCSVGDYCVVGPFARLCAARQTGDTAAGAAVMMIPHRWVCLCSGAEGTGSCWALPRGEPFDEEEAEDAMRQKSSRFCGLSVR